MGQVNKPNLLIIGAAKSGTTALHNFLNEHPNIFMSKNKEPNYFALSDGNYRFKCNTIQLGYYNSFIYNWNQYLDLFKTSNKMKIYFGESSPIYLYYRNSVINIRNKLGNNVKFIAILRNPVERAFSNFLHHIMINLETTNSFEEALKMEDKRIKENWWWGFHYKKAGKYFEQLIRYYRNFNENNIKVIIYDDWSEKPQFIYNEICNFLGVKRVELNISKKYKESKIPKSTIVHNIINANFFKRLSNKPILKNLKPLKTTINNINQYKPKLNNEIYNRLLDYYMDDINNLEKLINKDLSIWKKYKK